MDILDTTGLIKAIFDSLGKVSTADLAYSAHAYLAKGLAALAVEKADCARRQNGGFHRRRRMQPDSCHADAGNGGGWRVCGLWCMKRCQRATAGFRLVRLLLLDFASF